MTNRVSVSITKDQNGMAEQNGKRDHRGHDEVRRLVEDAVSQAVQAQLSQLQSHIVEQVLGSLPDTTASVQTSTTPTLNSRDAGNLVQAVANIHAGSTQREILRALLDTGSSYASRIALFVVKADLSAGPAAHTFQHRLATPGNIAEMGTRFLEQFGPPANEQVLALPLTLKDKVAALVYADGGDSGKLDSAALELLVIATSAWLEVISLRKQAVPREDGDAPATAAPSHLERPAPTVQTVSSFSDPFASHAPTHKPPRVVPEPDHAAEVVEVAAHAHQATAAAPAAAADPLAGLSPEDADIHRKAQRFARLLVDEIKLYNQAKVAEGRRNKDLYDRLKEDIDKSRGTFQKRYGNTVAASADYFQHELLRSLAEDDISIMGSNFRP
jgi:hypothetical protein